MTNESDLVPLRMHNLLTAGPAPWTDTRVPSEVWHVARAVYGTSTEDDEKRVYRTLQAALWKLAATQPEAQSKWQPIKKAPKDESVLLYGAKRLKMCVGMNHSRDGWVTDTTSEWMSMYTPTHWMPLPAAPSAQAPQPEAQPTTNNYRKKPVVIEAIQWDGSWGSMEAIKAAFPAMEVCGSTLHPPTKTVRGWSIRTLEGSHVVSVGDYIIKGVKGEFYPCKPDIFAMTYEPAAPSAQAEPQKPNYRAECWPESPHNKLAEQGGK